MCIRIKGKVIVVFVVDFIKVWIVVEVIDGDVVMIIKG